MANYATEVKLFGRWSFEDVEVKDIATKLADCGGAHKPSYYEFGAGLKLTLADIGKDVAGDDF